MPAAVDAAQRSGTKRQRFGVGGLIGGAEVVAGGEVVPCTLQDDDFDVGVVVEFGKRAIHFFEKNPRLRVAIAGAIQPHDPDGVFSLHLDLLVAHSQPPVCRG
jgi:hypothetical protein